MALLDGRVLVTPESVPEGDDEEAGLLGVPGAVNEVLKNGYVGIGVVDGGVSTLPESVLVGVNEEFPKDVVGV